MSAPPSPWARRGGRAPGPVHGDARDAARDDAHHDAREGARGDASGATRRMSGPSRATADPELRMYGANAIDAVFERRPQDLRKVWLAQSRVPRFGALLAFCARQRIGYRVVGEEDLRKLAGSAHHEGIVADVARTPAPPFAQWLRAQAGEVAACALMLDGVGNPHNLGAILRSAAHFGVAGVLVPEGGAALSGAAARVAEGGAEHVPLVTTPDPAQALPALEAAGFTVVATVVDGGDDVFAAPLPARAVLVLGAEGAGMDRALAARCARRVSIPGTGAVKSLNVAAATAVLLAQWRAGTRR